MPHKNDPSETWRLSCYQKQIKLKHDSSEPLIRIQINSAEMITMWYSTKIANLKLSRWQIWPEAWFVSLMYIEKYVHKTMVITDYILAEMFARILWTNIAKLSLIPKTWMPGSWLSVAKETWISWNGWTDLKIILAEMVYLRPSTKTAWPNLVCWKGANGFSIYNHLYMKQ